MAKDFISLFNSLMPVPSRPEDFKEAIVLLADLSFIPITVIIQAISEFSSQDMTTWDLITEMIKQAKEGQLSLIVGGKVYVQTSKP